MVSQWVMTSNFLQTGITCNSDYVPTCVKNSFFFFFDSFKDCIFHPLYYRLCVMDSGRWLESLRHHVPKTCHWHHQGASWSKPVWFHSWLTNILRKGGHPRPPLSLNPSELLLTPPIDLVPVLQAIKWLMVMNILTTNVIRAHWCRKLAPTILKEHNPPPPPQDQNNDSPQKTCSKRLLKSISCSQYWLLRLKTITITHKWKIKIPILLLQGSPPSYISLPVGVHVCNASKNDESYKLP